jgi:hypothetical protein
LLVVRSTTETVLLPPLLTYSRVPAGLIANAEGLDPTLITSSVEVVVLRSTNLFAEVSNTATPLVIATYARFWPATGLTTTAVGALGRVMVLSTAPVDVSITDSVLAS